MCNLKKRRDSESSDRIFPLTMEFDELVELMKEEEMTDEDMVDNARPCPLVKGGQGRSNHQTRTESMIVLWLLILIGIPMVIWMYCTY